MVWWVHTMWPLPIVVAEASTCAAWGLAWAALFFLFESCVTICSGVPNARRKCFSFSVWHFVSLERIVRVNRGAEGALECFEELKNKKKGKKWRCSLLVHYSQSLPESCRMRILRLVSKSQRSIFELKCRQKFNLSPGTSSFFTFKFLPCVPARASSY